MKFAKPNNMEILNALKRPIGKIKMVLDTDAYNEIDDQYAIAYSLLSEDKLDLQAIYAAPFSNKKAATPKIGMEKSYDEILNVLNLMKRSDMHSKVLKGSEFYLSDSDTPVISDAANDIVRKAIQMPVGDRLYVVGIGAITNIASAILIEPKIISKIVVVWLGGNSLGWKDNLEFNCMQDKIAAQVVFNSGVPLVQLPVWGVTSHLITTEPELRHYLKGKNELCEYLYEITCKQAIFEGKNKVWSKEIWDIIAIAWLIGDQNWMEECFIHSPIITLEDTYSYDPRRHFILQVQNVNRDYIFQDLFSKLQNN